MVVLEDALFRIQKLDKFLCVCEGGGHIQRFGGYTKWVFFWDEEEGGGGRLHKYAPVICDLHDAPVKR